MDRSRASASAIRPTDSSQRGDSGNALRRYQTTSAPNPPSANMARQPKCGMMSVPRSAATGKPLTTMTFMPPSHLPRVCGGTNSVIVEYPTTFSAPRPTPVTKRSRVSTAIEGAKAGSDGRETEDGEISLTGEAAAVAVSGNRSERIPASYQQT